MSELSEKVKTSVERLKAFEPKNGEGYYLAFSGGKDSVVCKALLDLAGVKYDATYRVTSVDPPELVRFIKEKHPDVKREIPHYSQRIAYEPLRGRPATMWNLIPMKMLPPTRVTRYCCSVLKESGGDGRITVTGVRWAESVNRKKNHGAITVSSKNAHEFEDNENFSETKFGGFISNNDNVETRQMVERCYKHRRITVNPIVDWTDTEVWQFIHAEKVPYCGLYDMGFHRLGCIGCPLATTAGREREFLMYPKYKSAYLRAFDKMLKNLDKKGRLGERWRIGRTPTDIFNWWMNYDILPGQIDLFEDGEEVDE